MFDRFKRRKDGTSFSGTAENNAYGGTPGRIFPTVVRGQTFTPLITSGVMASGIAPRIAYRPPRAPMLDSADFHTNIPTGTGMVAQTKSTPFHRNAPFGVSAAAVDEVTHINDENVHPSVKRASLRGELG